MPVKVPKADLWRAIRALCAQCRGFQTRSDCLGRVCPLYFVLKQAKLEPIEWWRARSGDWEEASNEAYIQAREEAAEARPIKIRIRRKKRKRVKLKMGKN